MTTLGEFRVALDESAAQGILPERFTLYQNYPNPFNPQTRIAVALPADGRVRLRVFDVLGQEVRVLLDGQRPAGYQEVVWDGTDRNGRAVSSGVYFAKAEFFDGGTVGATAVKKMLLMK